MGSRRADTPASIPNDTLVKPIVVPDADRTSAAFGTPDARVPLSPVDIEDQRVGQRQDRKSPCGHRIGVEVDLDAGHVALVPLTCPTTRRTRSPGTHHGAPNA